MSLQSVPVSERKRISFFGCTNAGKSSLINAITNQNVSLVSDIAGTTTDPVKKSMELLPLGPVLLVDTAGFDDETELGKIRINKTKEVLLETDLAILVLDCSKKLEYSYKNAVVNFLQEINANKCPLIVVFNKEDLISEGIKKELEQSINDLLKSLTVDSAKCIFVSSKTKESLEELKNLLASTKLENQNPKKLVSDFLHPQDFVVLVIPLDESAPKERLILPQQMALRDILDAKAIPVCCSVENLTLTIQSFTKKPALVITDSQAFAEVGKLVPQDINLTSFSILMARYKGNLEIQLKNVQVIESLKDGDKILISEGCTHHRQCNDIGTVKIPRFLQEYTGKKLTFDFTSGASFAESLKDYALVVHCGGCMLSELQIKNRVQECLSQNVPFTNYGMLLAKVTGQLEKATAIFGRE